MSAPSTSSAASPSASGGTLRILVCQTAAGGGVVEENVARWEQILEAYGAEDEVDVIHFPETAFSRYFFRDFDDAFPSMEVEGKGPIFQFLSPLAKRLQAYVVCGYMEMKEDDHSSAAPSPSAEHGLNSLYVLGRNGELLRESYHKRDLFQPDYTWCRPGAQDQPLTIEISSRGELEDRPQWRLTAGLINCQEILGNMDDSNAGGGPAARRLRNERIRDGDSSTTGYDTIDLILYSTCWPLFLADLPEPPRDFAGVWEGAIKKDFLLRGLDASQEDSPAVAEARSALRKRPLVVSVACDVGSEKNVTLKESWGGRNRLEEKLFPAEFLSKRGCSGVKVYSLPPEGSRAPLRGADDVRGTVPPSEAREAPSGLRLAARDWDDKQLCMSCEVEEARLFSIHI
mmetsp:Transcript_50135/g.154929  ORF Transcript_50135/g.154929 Transcript_50135/m.154929 type:complete len:400 (-) Transcript_50135:136-1335(-)